MPRSHAPDRTNIGRRAQEGTSWRTAIGRRRWPSGAPSPAWARCSSWTRFHPSSATSCPRSRSLVTAGPSSAARGPLTLPRRSASYTFTVAGHAVHCLRQPKQEEITRTRLRPRSVPALPVYGAGQWFARLTARESGHKARGDGVGLAERAHVWRDGHASAPETSPTLRAPGCHLGITPPTPQPTHAAAAHTDGPKASWLGPAVRRRTRPG